MKNIRHLDFFRLFGVALFIYIISKIDIVELLVALKQINLAYFLWSILFLILSYLTRILRWKMLVDSTGGKFSFGQLTEILAKGMFLGAVIPGRLGEFWRVKYLVEGGEISGGWAFYTAFMDRILDILVVIVIGFLGVTMIHFEFGTLGWQLPVSALLCLIFLIYLLGSKRRARSLIKFLIPGFLKGKVDSFLVEFYQAFAALKLKLFLKVLVLAFLYYLFGGAVFYYFIALALGVTIPFWYFFLIVAVVWLAVAIPVSFFGIGTREATFIYFFSFLDISAYSAVAISLVALFCNVLIVTIPGAILFLRHK